MFYVIEGEGLSKNVVIGPDAKVKTFYAEFCWMLHKREFMYMTAPSAAAAAAAAAASAAAVVKRVSRDRRQGAVQKRRLRSRRKGEDLLR